MLDPSVTYAVLLVTQTLHLLHHRLAKRHVSFAEVVSSGLLCIPAGAVNPPEALAVIHLVMAGVQVIGSVWIKRLSPEWERDPREA